MTASRLLPCMVTMVRLCGSGIWLSYAFSVSAAQWIPVTGIFAFLALTDYADGFLARLLHAESLVGALLDPLADKALVLAGLLYLSAVGWCHPVLLFLLVIRDLGVMAVREYALTQGMARVAVSYSAKVKTACTLVFIVVGLVAASKGLVLAHVSLWYRSLYYLWGVSAIGTAWISGLQYMYRVYVS